MNIIELLDKEGIEIVKSGYVEYQNGSATCAILLLSKNVVMAIELQENMGKSITNAAEEIIPLVAKRWKLKKKTLRWIECYYGNHKNMDEVIFKWSDSMNHIFISHWRKVEMKDIREYIPGLLGYQFVN